MKELIKQQPMPGDVIYASRGLYKHYGIYIGNGRVVHFAALGGNELDASKAEIVETSLAEFLKGADLAVEYTGKVSPFAPDEVVRRAESCVGRGRGEYDLVFNNCEHFAHWCKYGERDSKQVKDVFKGIAAAGAAAVLAIGLGNAIRDRNRRT